MNAPLVVADDLSGAAETAAALGAVHAPRLYLWPDLPAAADGPVVVDTDSRELPADEAAARVRTVLAALPDAEPVFKKIDSLLRGNVAAEVAALLDPSGPVVLTPALPEHDRVVRSGVVLVGGVPLDQTSLWHLEPHPAPTSVAAALEDVPCTLMPLDAVRSDGLPGRLAASAGAVAVCDAETGADLDALVAAALQVPGARLVGSSALARALGRRMNAAPRPDVVAPGGVTVHALWVLGTGADGVGQQAELLQAESGAVCHVLDPAVVAGLDAHSGQDLARGITDDLATSDVVLRIADARVPGIGGGQIVQGLAALVAAVRDVGPERPLPIMLTGGQTARGVLDALGCHRLTLLEEVHPGAVLMTTDDGWLVATRPGSHGGPDSLVQIHRAMLTHNQEEENR